MSLVTLFNDKLTVTVSSRGAEIMSIVDENGVERLWDGDPAVWSGRAPVLFPVAGGLRDDYYTLDGVRYDMPKHGFVRKKEFQVEKAGATEAVFLMNEKDPGFPFEYEFRVMFRLEENTLRVTYRVSNLDSREFYYGVGAHEAYAAPGGIEHYTMVFDEAEKFENYELVGNLIKPVPEEIAEAGDRFPLKSEYFAVDALVFRTFKSRGVTLVNDLNDRKIRVEFPGHDVLMFWQKYKAPYICIEPWVNAPDTLDSDHRIEHKPGCIRLAPGATEDRVHTITVL